MPGSADQFVGPSITAAIGAFEAFQATMNTRYDKLLANGARKICLSAKIRMQPASIWARACRARFCPDVDTRAYLISAPARFAGPGGERVVLIGDGEAGRVSITPQPDGNGSAAVVRHSGFSTPFRHSLPAGN